MKVAVLIPCLNEEATIGKVVKDFKQALPEAEIFVFDNNSTDKTAEIAAQAQATVIHSLRRGKGNVVKHMFETIDADIYVMADGDDTYPATDAGKMVEKFKKSDCDMLVGCRLQKFDEKSFRKFHQFGNNLVSKLISILFNTKVTDVLSGYRVISRKYAKTIPLLSEGFEVETEMTLQAAAKNFKIKEVPVEYGVRPKGSQSKLRTYSDGFLILRSIAMIFKDYKPLLFFSFVALLFAILSLLCGYVPIKEYYQIGEVPHFPRAILASGLGILSAVSFAVGLILDTIAKYHNENFQLWCRYLSKKD